MMEKYEELDLKVIFFNEDDIITTSERPDDEGQSFPA